MRKSATGKKSLFVGSMFAATLASVFGVSFAAFVATLHIDTADNTGRVGILSYFHCGRGTPSEPFVITRPRHFYNLSKLQSIGAFSGETYYFQIGYPIVSGNSNLFVYSSDSANPTQNPDTYYSQVLDLSYYDGTTEDRTIHSIGSHAYPFRSIVDGKQIVIANLHVSSEPDDVGVFGYVSDEGSLNHLTFENTTIAVDGYANALTGPYDQAATFDDSARYIIGGSSSLYTTADQTDTRDELNAVICDQAHLAADSLFGTTTLSLPTNTFTDPTTGNALATTYSVATSSTLLTATKSSDTTYSIRVNAESLLTDYNNFFKTDNAMAVGRVYVLANNTLDSFPVSRVVSSYEIYVVNVTTVDADAGTHKLMLGYVKDHYDTSAGSYTQYHHNNNIGVVVGHLDGSATNIYSYDAHFSLNRASSTHTSASFESDFALIGETGQHVGNGVNPNKLSKGATGYLSYDEVYDRIRKVNGTFTGTTSTTTDEEGNTTAVTTDYTDENGNLAVDQSQTVVTNSSGAQTSSSTTNPSFYDYPIGIDENASAPAEGSLYQQLAKDLSRSYTSGGISYHYGATSTSYPNAAAFKTGIIKGRSDDGSVTYNNGLGIFSLVSYVPGAFGGGGQVDDVNNSAPNVVKGNLCNTINPIGMGNNGPATSAQDTSTKYRLLYVASEIRDPTQQTDVNFFPYSQVAGGEVRGDQAPAWPRKYARTGETASDWSEAKRKSKVYLYEMTLDNDTANLERYFHGSNYTYLKNELAATLVDSTGSALKPSDELFGITLRKTDASGVEKDVTSFTKAGYIQGRRRIEFMNYTNTAKVSWNPRLNHVVEGNDGNGQTLYDVDSYKFYAYGELAFSLNRTCNVTIVYPYNTDGFNGDKNDNGRSGYITINKVDLAIQNPNGGTRYPYAAVPFPNSGEASALNYFPANGNDSTQAVAWNSSNSGTPLFVHTFKLDKGDYFIANNTQASNLPLMYVAVEGQTAGRLSGYTNFTVTADTLTNVDYLVSSPSTEANKYAYWTSKDSWYETYRTWCSIEFECSALPTSLRLYGKTYTIEDVSVNVLAIAFSKSSSQGLTSISLVNYGTSITSDYFKTKYVVFVNSDTDVDYGAPSQNPILYWNA